MMFRYDDRAEISYSVSFNRCWRRFIICKELTHLAIDTEERHFTKNPISLVQELINKVPAACDDDVHSEYLAYIGAAEMLLPWSLRNKMQEMMDQKKSDLEIANEFRAPEKVVNLVLRSESYRRLSE